MILQIWDEWWGGVGWFIRQRAKSGLVLLRWSFGIGLVRCIEPGEGMPGAWLRWPGSRAVLAVVFACRVEWGWDARYNGEDGFGWAGWGFVEQRDDREYIRTQIGGMVGNAAGGKEMEAMAGRG